MSGLYQTVVCTCTGGWTLRFMPVRAMRSVRIAVEWDWLMSCAAESAVEALVGSEPSRMKATCALPSDRRSA